MSSLVVARWTLLEARRRRLLAAGMALSVAFIVLYAVGFALLYRSQQRDLLGAQAQGQLPGGFDAGLRAKAFQHASRPLRCLAGRQPRDRRPEPQD